MLLYSGRLLSNYNEGRVLNEDICNQEEQFLMFSGLEVRLSRLALHPATLAFLQAAGSEFSGASMWGKNLLSSLQAPYQSA